MIFNISLSKFEKMNVLKASTFLTLSKKQLPSIQAGSEILITEVEVPILLLQAAEGNGILGRFEMLIIMPDHHQGLRQFQNFARKNVDEPGKFDNLIESALKSLNGLRKSNNDYIIRMPEFNIDSNIGAVPMFQEVI